MQGRRVGTCTGGMRRQLQGQCGSSEGMMLAAAKLADSTKLLATHHDYFDPQAAEVHGFQHLQLSALHIEAPQVDVSNAHPAGGGRQGTGGQEVLAGRVSF